MREAPELHWRWRGEPGPPVDHDLANTIVVIGVVFSGLLFFAGLVASGDKGVLMLFARGGAITLTGFALAIAQVALFFHASSRLMTGGVRLWTLTLPSALLWALAAMFAPMQGLPPRAVLAAVGSEQWVTGLSKAAAPQHMAALLGGALLLPLLFVGVASVAEGARRRRWPLARRGGWLSLVGGIGLLVMRWGWLSFHGLSKSSSSAFRIGGSEATIAAVERAHLSTAIAAGSVMVLVAAGLGLAWQRRSAVTAPADHLASVGMLVAPLAAWTALAVAGPGLDTVYAIERQALLDDRPVVSLLEPSVLDELRAAIPRQHDRLRFLYTRREIARVRPDNDAVTFVERALLHGSVNVLLDVQDRDDALIRRALDAHMAPPLPLPITFPVPLHRSRAGAIADLVLVWNSSGLKAQGEEGDVDVEALITAVAEGRGSEGRIVVVPVAGTVGPLLKELQRRMASPTSPRWLLGHSSALLDRPCGCFIGPAPGNDPDTYLDARLCLDGRQVNGEIRWMSRNSGSNTRRVTGTVREARWTLHDEAITTERAEGGWRFCAIDRYDLRQSGGSLTGIYVSEACDDRASVDLSPVECPEDMSAPARPFFED